MSDLAIILNKSFNDKDHVLQKNDTYGTTNTRLYDFLSKTSSEHAANIIDPLTTFDIQMQFYPVNGQGESGGIGNSFLGKLLKNIVKNSTYNKVGTQLILDISYYVQSMSIPQMSMPEASKVPTLFGEFPVNNLFMKPDNNTFTMSILNTKISLHDYIFYPWMREVTMPMWSYETQPYTTATVTVKFDKHSSSRYVFVGCRPSQIASRQPTQQPDGETTRDITMLFDYMYITSAETTNNYIYDIQQLSNVTNLFSTLTALQEKLNI